MDKCIPREIASDVTVHGGLTFEQIVDRLRGVERLEAQRGCQTCLTPYEVAMRNRLLAAPVDVTGENDEEISGQLTSGSVEIE